MIKKSHLFGERKFDYVVLHDFLQVSGGAEKLVVTLANCLKARLIVGFANKKYSTWTSPINGYIEKLGWPLRGPLLRYLITAYRFLKLYRNSFRAKAVIYSGILSPLAVHDQKEGLRVYYCHSPPRFLYDLRTFYITRSGYFARAAQHFLGGLLRSKYEKAVGAMHLIIVNSENVRQRLKRYLGLDAVVIHPPVDVERFSWIRDDGYFLSTARLEDYKRVDLIIRAFRKLPKERLVIVSGGSQEKKLRRLSADCANISFTSWLTQEELSDHVGRCRAVIYIPIDEDFGISPVEAMAAGKPVIGVSEGGLLETITDGATGILLPANLTEEDLIGAVRKTTAEFTEQMRTTCEARARRFSREKFCHRIRFLIEQSTYDANLERTRQN